MIHHADDCLSIVIYLHLHYAHIKYENLKKKTDSIEVEVEDSYEIEFSLTPLVFFVTHSLEPAASVFYKCLL